MVLLGGRAHACTSFTFTVPPWVWQAVSFAAYSLSVLDAVERRSRHEVGEKAGKGRGL